MNKHIQERRGQWREIEASQGGRLDQGKDCPPHILDLYRLARAKAEGQPDPPETGRLRIHIEKCNVCRHAYDIALEVAARELEGAPVDDGLAPASLHLISEDLRPIPGPLLAEFSDLDISAEGEAEPGSPILPLPKKTKLPIGRAGAYVKKWASFTVAASIMLALVFVCVIQAKAVARQGRLIRELLEELYDLRQRTDDSGLPTAITLDDPKKAFRVAGRNRFEVSGEVNSKFVREVRVRPGLKADDSFVPVYKGSEEPDPGSGPVRFSYQSPELPLKGEPIAPTLEVIPYPEMQRLFPEHFPPDKLQYSRNFLLAKDGIQADPTLVTITLPHDGETVERHCQLDGRLGATNGHPVAFVRPPLGNSWWVQDPVGISDGEFSGHLNVGDEMSPAGARFRIVVVVAKSKEEALKFKPGTEVLFLPPGLIRSNTITVIRQ